MTGRAPLAATARGRLAGSWDGDIAVFRGIPFAASAAGAGRWRPPAPPLPWDGIRQATRFGPAPVQPQPPRRSLMYHANFADRDALVMSEDCLYLNVWTPDPSAGADVPVMAWLHGGGNRFGHGSQDIHDGAHLAGHGIVVVTLNYRLGALGFLAHPELSARDPGGASGNWALLDIIAALGWVQENIAAFGGDPGRVTLAGNSAGAALACHLMASPLARGLFGRVIGQSSAGISRADGPVRTHEQAEEDGAAFAASARAKDLASLLGMSAVELAAAPGQHGPVVDGRVLVRDTQEAFACGVQAPVPLLVGSNADEGSIYTPASAADELARLAGRMAPGSAFRSAYPDGDPGQTRRSARLFTGETRFVRPVWRWAAEHARTSSAPVWSYRFHRVPPLPPIPELAGPPDGDPGYGAFHSAELPYVWDTLGRRDWPWTEDDRALAEVMSSAWARFTRDGNPNGDALPPWPEFSATDDDPRVMHFGEAVESGGATAGPAVPGRMDRLDAMRALDELAARPVP